MSNLQEKIKVELVFEHKKSYGVDRFYPSNEDANFICELMDRDTVTLDLLKKMKAHGWPVQINYQPFDL